MGEKLMIDHGLDSVTHLQVFWENLHKFGNDSSKVELVHRFFIWIASSLYSRIVEIETLVVDIYFGILGILVILLFLVDSKEFILDLLGNQCTLIFSVYRFQVI